MISRKILQFSRQAVRCNQSKQYINHFSFGEDKTDYGIKFDEEKIKQKMKEIKERKFTGKVKKE